MSRIVRHWAEHQSLSAHGALFVVREEGIRLRPYYDSRHLVTAAIGHLVTPPHTTITEADERRFSFHGVPDAIRFFRRVDLPVYERGVRETLGHAMVSRAEFDMCVDLCINIGTGGFERSRVAHYIRAGNYRAAANAFLGWAVPPELRGRRQRERERFRIGHW